MRPLPCALVAVLGLAVVMEWDTVALVAASALAVVSLVVVLARLLS